ncbi:MAG: M23 family metallopeptidase, partial [Bacteroidota bacterium]
PLQRHFLLFAMLCAVLPLFGWAQSPDFLWPVPQSRGISGTFGEVRSAHIHFGLDIRTDEKIGYDILAIEDGYIEKAEISYTSYGRVLYVRHPSGHLSVYGHLSRFYPELEAYMYDLQRKKRRFNQTITFPKGKFPVKRGQLIAKSGNTGLSGGPHLHLEIRDQAGAMLNPMFWYEDEVADPKPPFVTRLSVLPLQHHSRVEGRYERYMETPVKQGRGKYASRKEVISVKGPVGVQFSGWDKLEHSTNFCGFYSAELLMDGQIIWSFHSERFFHTEFLKLHLDYRALKHEDLWMTRCYRQPANAMGGYRGLVNDGVINITDDQVHDCVLRIRDYHGNLTQTTFALQRDTQPAPEVRLGGEALGIKAYQLRKKTLVIHTPLPQNKLETRVKLTYDDGSTEDFPLSYTDEQMGHTIIELQPGKLPVRAEHLAWDSPLVFSFIGYVSPKHSLTYERDDLLLEIPASSVYDTIFVELRERQTTDGRVVSRIYEIGDDGVPLKGRYRVKISPNKRAARFAPNQLSAMEVLGDGRFNRPQQANLVARPSQFRAIGIIGDDDPPSIRPENFREGHPLPPDQAYLHFTVEDDLCEIDASSIVGKIDGEWDVVEYYWYNGDIFYWFNQPLEAGTHELMLRLSDNCGNIRTQSFKFVLPAAVQGL